MDLLRGLAILLVIGGHVFSVPEVRGLPSPEWAGAVFGFLSPIRMPLMFILSGMLLPLALTKPMGTYVEGKLRHLVWPYVIWFAITVTVAGDLDAFTSFFLIIGGPYHLWFLAILICCFVIAPATKIVPPFVLAVLMQVALHIGDFSTNALNRFLFWGSIFFIGASLWNRRVRIASWGLWFPALMAALGLVALPLAELIDPGSTTSLGLGMLVANLPWTLLALWAGPRLPRVRVLEWVGQNSMVFYVVHAPVLVATFTLMSLADASPGVIYATGAMAAYGLCWLIARKRRHVQWLFAAPALRHRNR